MAASGSSAPPTPIPPPDGMPTTFIWITEGIIDGTGAMIVMKSGRMENNHHLGERYEELRREISELLGIAKNMLDLRFEEKFPVMTKQDLVYASEHLLYPYHKVEVCCYNKPGGWDDPTFDRLSEIIKTHVFSLCPRTSQVMCHFDQIHIHSCKHPLASKPEHRPKKKK